MDGEIMLACKKENPKARCSDPQSLQPMAAEVNLYYGKITEVFLGNRSMPIMR